MYVLKFPKLLLCHWQACFKNRIVCVKVRPELLGTGLDWILTVQPHDEISSTECRLKWLFAILPLLRGELFSPILCKFVCTSQKPATQVDLPHVVFFAGKHMQWRAGHLLLSHTDAFRQQVMLEMGTSIHQPSAEASGMRWRHWRHSFQVLGEVGLNVHQSKPVVPCRLPEWHNEIMWCLPFPNSEN